MTQQLAPTNNISFDKARKKLSETDALLTGLGITGDNTGPYKRYRRKITTKTVTLPCVH